MGTDKRDSKRQFCLVVPGRDYGPKARHAGEYKDCIRKIAKKDAGGSPYDGDLEIKVEYLFGNEREKVDGDNLLKTICDGLKGVIYKDDSQLIRHDIRRINLNSTYTIRGVPLTEKIAELLAKGGSFAIVRLRRV